MFHLLISETTKNWKRPAERSTLARMFDHGLMGKVCRTKREEIRAYLRGESKPAPGPDLERANHLYAIAHTFVEMQQHRHTADYDGSIKWTRVDTWERELTLFQKRSKAGRQSGITTTRKTFS